MMSLHHSLAAALWLLAAVGAWALVGWWAEEALSGKVQPWALVVLFWGVAAVSVAIHHLSQYLSGQLAQGFAQGHGALRRFWSRHGASLRLRPGA